MTNFEKIMAEILEKRSRFRVICEQFYEAGCHCCPIEKKCWSNKMDADKVDKWLNEELGEGDEKND